MALRTLWKPAVLLMIPASLWLGCSGDDDGGSDAPPVVMLTAPLAGNVARGNVTIAATATDDVGVTQVVFTVDGTQLRSVSVAPYGATWDARTATTGAHVIAATATDTAGQTASAQVVVTIGTGDQPPVVTWVAPAENAHVSGSVPIQVEASDDVSLASVAITLGATHLLDATSPPFRGNWDTCTLPEGPVTLAATATDGGGQFTTAPRRVVVENATHAPTLTATLREDAIDLVWTRCGFASSHRIYWSTSPGVTTESTRIDIPEAAAARFLHTGRTFFSHYYYRVASVFGTTETPLSNEVAVSTTPRNCRAEDHWCWTGSLTMSAIEDTWTDGETVWAVGGHDVGASLIVSGSGVDWLRIPPPRSSLGYEGNTSIWGSGANDVYMLSVQRATGDAAVLHFDGISWHQLTEVADVARTSRFLRVYGSSANDVWITHEPLVDDGSGAAVHYDGTRWTEVRLPFPGILWGPGSGSYWLAGAGRAARWDGSAWSEPVDTGCATADDISGRSMNDVWIVRAVDSTHGDSCHFAGSAWTRLATPTDEPLRFVAATSTHVFASGGGHIHEWTGTGWNPGNPGGVRGLATGNGRDVTAFDDTTISFFDGERWTFAYEEAPDHTSTGALTVSPGGDVFVGVSCARAVTGGPCTARVAKWHAGSWTTYAIAAAPTQLAAVADDDLWAVVGTSRIFRFAGVTFTEMTPLPGTLAADGIGPVFGLARNDVWVSDASGSSFYHWDGTSWATFAKPVRATVTEIWGRASDDLWASAGNTMPGTAEGAWDGLMHWNGTSWSVSTDRTASNGVRRAVHGDATRVWSVGAEYGVYDATSRMELRTGELPGLDAVGVAVVGANAWVAGAGETSGWIGRFDATPGAGASAEVVSPWWGAFRFTRLRARGASETWIAGTGGALLRRLP